MGNSSSNCFRSKEGKSVSSRQPRISGFGLSVTNIKIWKQSFGLANKKQLIDFDFPGSIIHKTFSNIEKDITRTYPESSFFANKKINLDTFSQVLRKLAVYFPKIGYTQGMNFIVGLFLMSGMSANQTFTICVKIFTNYDMMCLGLYEDYFPLNRLYCALTWEVVKLQNEKIKQKINKLNMFDDLWLFQWFTTLFIYSFPIQIISELWTFVFLHKYFALVRLASAFILQLWPQLHKCQSQIDFMNLMTSLKNIDQFKKVLKIQKVLKRAYQITNQEISKLVLTINLDTHNKFLQFFQLPENDRKVRYLQFMLALSEQRKQFLKSPHSYKFDRKQSDITVIDSLELSQAKILHQSLATNQIKNSNSYELLNQKLWKSDVQKLTNLSSNKSIHNEQVQTISKENRFLNTQSKNHDSNDQFTDYLSPKSKQSQKEFQFIRHQDR